MRLYLALGLGAALCLLAIVAFPFRFLGAPDISLISTLIAGNVMTAYLLVVHTIQRRAASTALLATAYVVTIVTYNFAAPILAAVLHAHTYPAQAISFVAHVGYGACFAAFAVLGGRRAARGPGIDSWFNARVTLLIAGGALVAVIAVGCVDALMNAYPALKLWLPWMQGPFALLSLAVFAARVRPTISNTWLGLALFSSALDSFLIVASPPASLGLFIGQAFGLISCVLIPTVYLVEFNRQYAWLSQSNARFRRQALTDELTGLGNRRYYDAKLESLFKDVAGLSNAQFSILAIDIDHFKRFNDTYGHVAGDDCLRQIARVLKSAMFRPEDEAIRYGGEEFVALLPGVDIHGARMVAERIRSRVYDLNIEHSETDAKRVTVSIGIAVGPQHGITPDHLFSHADAALYEAKHAGRNRIAEIQPPRTSITTTASPASP